LWGSRVRNCGLGRRRVRAVVLGRSGCSGARSARFAPTACARLGSSRWVGTRWRSRPRPVGRRTGALEIALGGFAFASCRETRWISRQVETFIAVEVRAVVVLRSLSGIFTVASR
jgi:hypothetical protein